MGKTKEPTITESKEKDFTCITFCPDLAKFGMTSLDRDMVALFTRRAYDIAASTRGVKVFLNGKKLPVGILFFIQTSKIYIHAMMGFSCFFLIHGQGCKLFAICQNYALCVDFGLIPEWRQRERGRISGMLRLFVVGALT